MKSLLPPARGDNSVGCSISGEGPLLTLVVQPPLRSEDAEHNSSFEMIRRVGTYPAILALSRRSPPHRKSFSTCSRGAGCPGLRSGYRHLISEHFQFDEHGPASAICGRCEPTLPDCHMRTARG